MDILKTFLFIYLGIGLVYALYIWLFAGDFWYAIPINMLGGPITLVYQSIRGIRRRKYGLKDIFEGKKAVIFDMDGTIIDSQPFRNEAVERVLISIGADWVYRQYPHGLNGLERWSYILKTEKDIETEFSVMELAKKTKKEFLKLYKNVEALDGFWNLVYFLREKKKLKLGLATNSDRNVTDILLERLDAEDLFDFSVTGDEVGKRKPHPEMYKKAAKALGVKPKEVVVFEDTIVGATAARGAGMEVVVIWDGEDEDPGDFPKGIKFFLPDFSGVSELIEKSLWGHLEEEAKDIQGIETKEEVVPEEVEVTPTK